MEHVDGIPAVEHSEGPEQRDRANSHVTSIAETDDPDDSELELPVGREASIETVDQCLRPVLPAVGFWFYQFWLAIQDRWRFVLPGFATV